MGLRAGLDGCGKSRPPPGFDPRTVRPVESLLRGDRLVRISDTETAMTKFNENVNARNDTLTVAHFT